MNSLASSLLAAVQLSQATRLLQLDTALPAATLLAERATLTESLHAAEPLRAEIDCVSTEAGLPYAVTLQAQGGDGAVQLQWAGGELPAGLNFVPGGNGTAQISGQAVASSTLSSIRVATVMTDLNASKSKLVPSENGFLTKRVRLIEPRQQQP